MWHNMKLGKAKPKIDKRTLKLEDYVEPDEITKRPKDCDWTKSVGSYGMMLNDRIGDCAVAGPGHMQQTWTKNAQSNMWFPTDEQILEAYKEISGYDGSDETDSGCVMLDVLNYWRQTGIGGHKIAAYVAVDPKNFAHVEAAIYLFGGVDTGFALPRTAANQSIWSVVGDGQSGDSQPYSWGGHCVPILAYNDDNPTCITWGQRLQMTWGFMRVYCDECYAVLSEDWLNNRKAPNGFDIDALLADLKKVEAA